MKLEIRAAGPDDEATISALLGQAEAAIVAHRGGAELVADRRTRDRVDERREVVGCVDGRVFGVASCERVGERARLSALYVDPSARRLGLGHLLLEHVVEVGRSWGCRAIDSVALPGDRATKNFFEAHGLRARLLVVAADI